ncbi:Uncharacterised protein [Ewingella americana]|uniref:Uncharacterized protein n=1 Tax=Ewingella americana TaxID=41202 RepID=A0A377NES5_9GAMM|nr:Uncharacterised protein [Ewingella americana]
MTCGSALPAIQSMMCSPANSIPMANSKANRVISTKDCRAALRARLRIQLAEAKGHHHCGTEVYCSKEGDHYQIETVRNPTPAIASLPNQLTRKVLSTPISSTHIFSKNIGTARGVISRQNNTR